MANINFFYPAKRRRAGRSGSTRRAATSASPCCSSACRYRGLRRPLRGRGEHRRPPRARRATLRPARRRSPRPVALPLHGQPRPSARSNAARRRGGREAPAHLGDRRSSTSAPSAPSSATRPPSPLLIKLEFFGPTHAGRHRHHFAYYAFLGALVGSVTRPFGGWLADRFGGARITLAHLRRDGPRTWRCSRRWRARSDPHPGPGDRHRQHLDLPGSWWPSCCSSSRPASATGRRSG